MAFRKRILIGTISVVSVAIILGVTVFLPEIADFLIPEEGLNIPSLDVFSEKKVSSCRFDEITYQIGEIDPGFGISEDVFKKAIEEAEDIWESATGRNIFVEKENNNSSEALVFRLIFDDRQAGTFELKELFKGISSAEDRYVKIKEEYESLATQIIPVETELESLKREYSLLQEDLFVTVSLYNQRKSEYEEEVVFWNNQGGAPEKEYERLLDEKNDIDILYRQIIAKEEQFLSLQNELNSKVGEYNEIAGKINTFAGIMNRLASSINKDVSVYNRLQADREEFVTGTYREEGGTKSIEVYQFFDHKELVIILAHEMGHALGLGHALSEDSIMYPKITYQEAKLSEEDIMLLKSVCQGI
jgi:predicted  nucleic acid-binding Zn-ribbon protein